MSWGMGRRGAGGEGQGASKGRVRWRERRRTRGRRRVRVVSAVGGGRGEFCGGRVKMSAIVGRRRSESR